MKKLKFEKEDNRPSPQTVALRNLDIGEAFMYPHGVEVRIRVKPILDNIRSGLVHYMTEICTIHEVSGDDRVIPVDVDPVKWREKEVECDASQA